MSDKKQIYQGNIVTLNLERVQLPNGVSCNFEIVHHPGGACIVALDERMQVCLLKHYRPAVVDWLWELPAGKIDNQEVPINTAKRELLQEVGLEAKNWTTLAEVLSSPGVFTERITVFLAQEFTQLQASPDADEVFEVHWLPFQEALAWCGAGKIQDAKTLIGLLRAEQFINEQNYENK